MRDRPHDWQAYLPDPKGWPQGLTQVVRRGEYVYLHHNEKWLVVLSTKEGDLVHVQKGGKVQARLAVNRTTGEIVHPTPGVRIEEWQADLLGYGQQYREASTTTTRLGWWLHPAFTAGGAASFVGAARPLVA